MMRLDSRLERLFRAAAQARPGLPEVPPYGLETRVLAAWRAPRETDFWEAGLLVRGLILASVIMALSFWPVLSMGANPFAETLDLADSTIQLTNAP